MKRVKKLIKSIRNKKHQVEINRLDTTNDDGNSKEIKKIINLLCYTKKSEISYSAIDYEIGYHSFEIDGQTFHGQRNPQKRFLNLPVSFNGLTVLDIGCNQGGMLYSLQDKLKYGIGIDYDSRMINVANKIKSHTKANNLDYYAFDLEKESLNYIYDFLPEEKVDVVFLLSVCKWIKNWQEVIIFCSKISTTLIFESNGRRKKQRDQIDFLRRVYKTVQLINNKSEDDPKQKNRKLYLCFK